MGSRSCLIVLILRYLVSSQISTIQVVVNAKAQPKIWPGEIVGERREGISDACPRQMSKLQIDWEGCKARVLNLAFLCNGKLDCDPFLF